MRESLRYAPSMAPKAQRLPRTVWVLGWISFFADVASEMAYPIIPVFVKTVLGVSTTALGAIEGIANGLVSIMKGWSGWHSDRGGRRVPYIQVGYGLSTIGKPLIGFASGAGLVLAARSLDRIGKGVRTTARDALIADAVPKSLRGRAFGLHRALDNAGAFVGAIVAITFLALLGNNLRAIFFIAFVPGLLSVLITLFLRELPTDAASSWAPTEARQAERFSTGYWKSLTVMLLFALGDSTDTFLLLRAAQHFEGVPLPSWLPALPPIATGLVWTTLAYTLYNITALLVSYPGGALSDRIGRWPVMALGMGIYVAVYVGFAFLGTWWLWLLFALYGVYSGLTNGVQKSLVADVAPAGKTGTAMGIFYMSTGFAAIFASLIAGVLWDAFGPSAAFGFGAGMAALSLVLIPILRPLRH